VTFPLPSIEHCPSPCKEHRSQETEREREREIQRGREGDGESERERQIERERQTRQKRDRDAQREMTERERKRERERSIYSLLDFVAQSLDIKLFIVLVLMSRCLFVVPVLPIASHVFLT
jgi:Flp pilus assembly protein TadB